MDHEMDGRNRLMMESEINPPAVKKPFIELTRKKAAGWLVIVLFVCSWLFVLGILVGRGTAPVQFDVDKPKKDLVNELKAAVETEKEEKKTAEATASSDPVSPDGKALEFYEDLKSTKESQENINMGAAPKREILPLSVPQKEVPVKKIQVKEPMIAKVNEKAVAPAETKPLKTTEPALPEIAVKGPVYTIQIASVKDQESADKLVGDLVKKGYPEYRSSGEVPGKGTWHRVRIGEFREKSEAETVLARIGKDKVKGIIVSR
jgi:cell division septation protein DedD